MTFTARLSSVFPGMGQPQVNDANQLATNQALSGTGQQTNTLPPSSGSFSPTMSKGKFRIKVYAGTGTTPTLTDIVVTVTDGTNTIEIFAFHPNSAIALSSTSWYDSGPQEWEVDINATSASVKTTLGGTSPGASLDWEILGTI